LETPAIIARVCLEAKNGDIKAAEIILQRTWPEPRSSPISIGLRNTDSALADGDITLGDYGSFGPRERTKD
jgi:hypothetical protein